MNPKVSIIVPVYNAEQTLRRCVDSVLSQTYTDFELLLVDDGSRDSSAAICDGYAARDSRVRVIHKPNSGVSDTRNQGLSQARGTYLQFLDSDDWITPDATSAMVRAAEEHQCDLVISDFYRVVGERVSRKGDIDDDTVLSREEFASHMMENPADFYYGVLWNKLYRRDIVEAHHLRMDPDISWCEDFMFNLEYIRFAERFYALQVPIYYYVKTKGSLVATQGLSIAKTVRMKLTVFEYYDRFYRSVFDEEEYEKSRLKVYRFLVDAAKDGAVPPTILPGSQKLGSERLQVPPDGLEIEGILADTFRERKLLERFLETAALKNGLTVNESYLLLCLDLRNTFSSRKALADFLGVPRSSLTMALQRLAGKGLLQWEDLRTAEGTKEVRFQLSPQAAPVLEDLKTAQADYSDARLAGFSPEELEQYHRIAEHIRQNVRNTLQ